MHVDWGHVCLQSNLLFSDKHSALARSKYYSHTERHGNHHADASVREERGKSHIGRGKLLLLSEDTGVL